MTDSEHEAASMTKRAKASRITAIHPADESNQVVTVEGGQAAWRRKPCSGCPWRKDQAGSFPAEAFRHSATTTYDMAHNKFACHESGAEKPATCAGFLLRGADHNLSVRIGRMEGRYLDVDDGGHVLFEDYRAMAIANGVDPEDPCLKPCR